MSKFTAEDYYVLAKGKAEYGWCVKYGDDTICDVYAGKEMAELIAECLNHSPEIAGKLIKLGY